MYCIRNRIPYIGIGLTQQHCDWLYTRLRSRTVMAMMDSSDTDLYDPALATITCDANALEREEPSSKGKTVPVETRKGHFGGDK